jgi:hypothetical protein
MLKLKQTSLLTEVMLETKNVKYRYFRSSRHPGGKQSNTGRSLEQQGHKKQVAQERNSAAAHILNGGPQGGSSPRG